MDQSNPKRQDKQFLALQRQWYSKLAQTGFVDIEREDGLVIDRVGGPPPVSKRTPPEYYRLVRQSLHEHRFKSKTERAIWELHGNGLPGRAIAKQVGVSKSQVYLVIAKYYKKWIGPNANSNKAG